MNPRILIADADPVRRDQRVRALRMSGYQVTSAQTFAEARAEIEANTPHILIAAVRLGPFNGLHLAIWGRAEYPSMSAIITADDVDVSLEREAAACGAVFVLEPMPNSELAAIVARVLPSLST